MKKIFLLLALFTVIIVNPFSLRADDIDSKGKEFYLAFMPNFHQNSEMDPDSLYIFLGAEKPTNIRIDYQDRYGVNYSDTISITDPTKIYTFQVSWIDFEVIGAYYCVLHLDKQDEVVARNTFHITADNDITVYAHSEAYKTSEAFLVLPVDALGDEYYVLSYNSDAYFDVDQLTPSQFLIVATEDNTKVNLNPTYSTVNIFASNQIVLNKGEAYLVQAYIEYGNPESDLTGSFIKADKKIAVFTGQQRATIPLNKYPNPSRDCIIEQLIPVQSWGENAYITPFYQPPDVEPTTHDIFRVIASNDSTKITVNGAYVTTLDHGEFYEGIITSAISVSGDKPIMVGEYKRTSSLDGNSNFSISSDALMLIIPPAEQFLTSYRFINIQANDESYKYQFVNIVVADSSKDKVVFDGITLSTNEFVKIPNSNYSYSMHESSDGIHSISCPTPIGIFVYGYGDAVAYGYTGGMSFVPLDLMAPRVLSSVHCYQVNGKILENGVSDKGIKNITTPYDSIINVNVSLGSYKAGDTTASYSANLQNIFQDGYFVIHASDLMDHFSSSKIGIPGFTLSGAFDQSVPIVVDTVAIGSQKCIKVKIYNYGLYSHKIFGASFSSGNTYSFNNTFPITIKAKDSVIVEFCMNSNTEQLILDSLIINDSCASRMVSAVSIFFANDTHFPVIDSTVDACGNYINLNFSDIQRLDLGLKPITIDSISNLTIADQSAASKTAVLKLNRIDPLQDSYIKVSCSDSVGHVSTYEKFIQGYTLTVLGIDSAFQVRNLDTVAMGSFMCDSLSLYNYGSGVITVSPNLFVNTLYSIPPSQLPLTIAPKDSAKLAVCFAPNYSQTKAIFDTLALSYNCLTKLIKYQTNVSALVFSSSSECDADVSLNSNKAPNGYTLNGVYPNPAATSCVVKINSLITGSANVVLYDIYGRRIENVHAYKLIQKGENSIELNLQNAAVGTYLLEVEIAGRKSQKIINIYK